MIHNYIKKLHTKSHTHRKNVTFISSGVITFAIGLVWLSTWNFFNPNNLFNKTGSQIAVEEAPQIETKSPLNVMKLNLSNAYTAVQNTFGVKKATEEEKPPVLEYVPD